MKECNFRVNGELLGTWDLPFTPKEGDTWEDLMFVSVSEATDGSDFDIEIEYV